MSGGSPSTTNNVTKTELPAWVDAAGKANYDAAVALGDKPLQQYQGNTVAPLSQTTLDSMKLFKDNQNAGAEDLTKASGIFSDIAARAAGPIGGMDKINSAADIYSGLADTTKVNAGINSMLNPYLGEVEGNALRALDESRGKALMANSDNALAAKSFGGGRHGVVDAITNAESIKNAGDLSAGIRRTGYNDATAAYLNSQNAAGSGLLSAGNSEMGGFFNGLNAQQGAGNSLMASSDQSLDQLLKRVGALGQIGSTEQVQKQAEINADIAKFTEGRDKELNDLNLRLTALGMSPYSQTSTTTGTSTQGSAGTDWAMTGMGLLSLFAGLSEDDMKEDKVNLGPIGESGINRWAFRYKGDPKSYPKVVGVMASEVEEHLPEAVTRVNGKRVIDYGMLAGAL